MMKQQRQPRFLDLRKITLPLPGIVSILHRISGILMVVAIPVGIYLLEQSIQSQEGYSRVTHLTNSLAFKVFALAILWSLSHHLFAGFRFLLLDIDIGVDRQQARNSSKVVFAASIITTLLFVRMIW